MSELIETLAGLYPQDQIAKVRSLIRDAGMDPDKIDLSGDSYSYWPRILEDAQNRDSVEAIVNRAADEFPNRRESLDKELQLYLEKPIPEIAPSLPIDQLPTTPPGLFRYCLDYAFPRLHQSLTRVGTLPEPNETGPLHKYLLEFHAKIQNDFREKTYLPLAGRPIPSSPIAQEAGSDPFVSPIHQVIRQISGSAQGGDSASAQIAAVNQRSRVVKNILGLLMRSEDPLVLLGDPGSGKTMTLQQAAMTLADKEVRRVFPRIPIIVRLSEFHVKGKAIDAGDVREHVKQLTSPGIRRWFNALESNGRLVIFFDGMDEMSRERYNEHTEALSLFAGGTPAKTLFSCRITDFSPKFIHRRLVLLPFDSRQVLEYLSKYITGFPISIDGQLWTLNGLARHISKGELPVEANNPFVLWLLCLYVQNTKAWPRSRVELLRFYNEQNYQRKYEEISSNDPAFPEMNIAFLEWARFAYVITDRDSGAAISVRDLKDEHDGLTVEQMIQVGKRCGILAESGEGYDYLIRFQHHRFQEYFTALHIHETRPPIKWLNKLDAPRWQETMLNLILMGQADDVVNIYAGAISELSNTLERQLVEVKRAKKKEGDVDLGVPTESLGDETPSEPAPVTPEPLAHETASFDHVETVLADRVEICSRIIRQAGAGAPTVRQILIPPLRQAIGLLADNGSPITQVKMLRVCQNLPEIDFIEALRKPLNSPIGWVRDQALILIASHQGSARAVGSDFATEMGHDLANGLFPLRWPAYWKAARGAESWGYWWSLLMGTVSYLLYLLLLFVAAGAIYFGAWSLASRWSGQRLHWPSVQTPNIWQYADKAQWDIHITWPKVAQSTTDVTDDMVARLMPRIAELNRPAFVAIFLVMLVAVTIIGLGIRPAWLWAWVLGTAMAIVTLIPLGIALWEGYATPLLYVSSIAFIGYSLVILGAVAFHFTSLALYLGATTRTRNRGHAGKTFFVSAWRNYPHGFLSQLLLLAFILPIVYLMIWVLRLVLGALQFISDASHLPFHPLVNVVLLIFAAASVYVLVHSAVRRSLAPIGRWLSGLRWIVGGFGLLALIWGALLGVGWGIFRAITLLSGNPFWIGLLRVLAIVISLVGAAVLFLALFYLGRFIVSRLRRLSLQRFLPGSIKPEDWKEEIAVANASTQAELLRRTDHQTLSLTADEYLEVMKEVRDHITAEPALSTYWDQRNELEQALRQERHG
jgi:hypothetical protein